MFLIVNGYTLLPLYAAVVIIGRKLLQAWMEDRLSNPPIEPDQLWSVFVYQFTGAHQPVIKELFVRQLSFILGFLPVVSGAVKPGIVVILHVRIERHPTIKKPPMLSPV